MTATATIRPRPDHPEILDDRSLDPRIVRRSMRDVVISNRLFGGRRAVLSELTQHVDVLPERVTLLDVGTGLGDIPAAAAQLARRRGRTAFSVGLDLSPDLARESRMHMDAAVVADAGALPFRDRSAQVVICSQVLHHFAPDTAAGILREMNRVCSHVAIVGDIRRSRVAAIGLWLASFLLRFHPVSRHDGVASVRRGFTSRELAALGSSALGHGVIVRRHPGFRLTASWRRR
jgi:SAM-dependent methyltransferase